MKKNQALFSRVIAFFLLVGLTAAGGCGPRLEKAHKSRQTRVVLGTLVRVDICLDKGDEEFIDDLFERIWERVDEIHANVNAFDIQSDIGRLTNAYEEPVQVSQDTFFLMNEALKLTNRTGHVFDVTIRPLVLLWKDAARNQRLPSMRELQEIKKSVGPQHVRLIEPDRVQILHPLTRFDLGGIAKGYAADQVAKLLRAGGVHDFLIDAGGDIYAGGMNCDGHPWRIGIRDPWRKAKVIGVLNAQDAAVATSGDYEQHYFIGSQKWSHIINPVTGYPVQHVVSATVVASDAVTADAFATALCVLGPRQGEELVREAAEDLAYFIIEEQADGSYKFFMNDNYRKRLAG